MDMMERREATPAMEDLFARQRARYLSGATRPVRARLDALAKLHEVLKRHEGELLRALAEDLGKSPEEAYMTEMGVVYDELRFARRRLRAWSLPRFALPSVGQFPGYGLVRRDPYGLVLILSPWNYPLQLCLAPLIAAVAAGNCVVARPSSQAPRTAQALAAVVSEAFAPDHVSVALGDAAQAETLVRLPFDKIFFTGSPAVGRRVMAAASENLTPVTLELGGKSPAIVAADADVALAARRIVFGKTLNAGQTCVAPDYVLVARGVENALLDALRGQIRAQFGPEPLQSPDLARIVNRRHFERLSALLSEGRLICGGQTDPARLKIAPTVLFGVPPDGAAMSEEIFGPILPVLPFSSMQEALAFVRAKPAPLALYLFTRDRDAARHIMADLAYGGGCVNDCVLHLANPRLPFGGVGQSGMGAYHGKAGFDCFTRPKSVYAASARLDLPVRYAPRGGRLALLRRLMR